MNSHLRDWLNEQVDLYNRPEFIENDPISIPHRFTQKQDIEIAGLMAAVFAWGNRRTIINKSTEFLKLMDDAPHDFLINHTENDLKRFEHFKHRTFQPIDALYFIQFLSEFYKNHTSLESLFIVGTESANMEEGLIHFHERFFEVPYALRRTKKHIPSPAFNSTCKRLNMFLRWMVRRDEKGVDFGIWQQIKPSTLICPIDVHVATTARTLQLLTRTANDWKSALELTENLKIYDRDDPVKYDFALFSTGIFGSLGDIPHRHTQILS